MYFEEGGWFWEQNSVRNSKRNSARTKFWLKELKNEKKNSKLKYIKGADGIFFGIRQFFRSELYQMSKRNGKRNLEKNLEKNLEVVLQSPKEF